MAQKEQQESRPMYYIKPYSRPGVAKGGLEKYDLVLHEGTFQEEHMTCLETISGSGLYRFLTGLDEEAPEVRNLPKDKREVEVFQIRSNVALIERAFSGTHLDPKDEHFWSKVVTLKPNNLAFWSTVKVTVDNFAKGLDPNDPKDLMLICSIKAGGFSLIHRSKQEAESVATPANFYLDEALETATFEVEPIKLRNKAVALLQQLVEKQPSKMTFVAVAIRAKRNQKLIYNKRTPLDAIYLDLDKFIHGQTDFEKIGYKASKEFIEFAEMEEGKLSGTAITFDALNRKDILVGEDRKFHYVVDDTPMGETREEVIAFVNNPANGTLAKTLREKYMSLWER